MRHLNDCVQINLMIINLSEGILQNQMFILNSYKQGQWLVTFAYLFLEDLKAHK